MTICKNVKLVSKSPIIIKSDYAVIPQIILKKAVAQTANLAEVQDAAGTVIGKLDKDGIPSGCLQNIQIIQPGEIDFLESSKLFSEELDKLLNSYLKESEAYNLDMEEFYLRNFLDWIKKLSNDKENI